MRLVSDRIQIFLNGADFGFLSEAKISLSIVSSGEINASVAGIATRNERVHALLNNWNAFISSKLGGESDEAITCINGKWIR